MRSWLQQQVVFIFFFLRNITIYVCNTFKYNQIGNIIIDMTVIVLFFFNRGSTA